MVPQSEGSRAVAVLAVIAASGSGKTTFLERLLPCLRARGVRTAVIKRARADFDVDVPGKDSHRLRVAGAVAVAVGGPGLDAWIWEHPHEDEPTLEALLARLDLAALDLVLVEGRSDATCPALLVDRVGAGQLDTARLTAEVVAVVTDRVSLDLPGRVVLPLDDPGAVAAALLGGRVPGVVLPPATHSYDRGTMS